MPNAMAALPNIGGAPVQCRKVWLTPTSRVPCSNASKTWNLLKFAGLPQTCQKISAANGAKFTTVRTCGGDVVVQQVFFPIVDMCASCEGIARQSCAMVPRSRLFGNFLGPAFPVSHVRQVSDLHPKFALRPHHVCKYGRHPICYSWD